MTAISLLVSCLVVGASGESFERPGLVSFSVSIDSRPASELLEEWRMSERFCGSGVVHEREVTWKDDWEDDDSGLELKAESLTYPGFEAAASTLVLCNKGKAVSALIEDLRPIDLRLPVIEGSPPKIHHFTGSICKPNDFEPKETTLNEGDSFTFTSTGGRGSDGVWPYFNLESGGQGMIVAVGWPGQWTITFSRQGGAISVRAGQEGVSFRLQPGESARSPRMVTLGYQGTWIDGQNRWRQWMIRYNMPRPGGVLPAAQVAACSSHQYHEMIKADTASQKMFIDRYLAAGFPLDYWWMDAGWYVNSGDWPNTGTWQVDEKRFPGGLRPISDHAHSRGVRTIVWFEPERVTPGTWLYEQHPEWLLGADGGQKLLDLGKEEARNWATGHIRGLIESQGIDLYRQDFNMEPLAHWRAGEAPDRRGLAENHHVSGYLGFWDELRQRFPDMLIDSCASGGRRNDIDTLARAVPLLRSDYIIEPVGNQGHMYGLSFWLPFAGTGTGAADAYGLRSVLAAHFTACYDMRTSPDLKGPRRLIGQWLDVADGLYGDYYPLTPYSLAADAWIGWQFHRADLGHGFVQTFRRAECPGESLKVKFAGLEPRAVYEVRDVDAPWGSTAVQHSGADLMAGGLEIRCPEKPSAKLYRYTVLRPGWATELKAEDVAWLSEKTREVLKGCVLKGHDGTELFTPDASRHYTALWTRDFAYMIEQAGDLIPNAQQKAAVNYLLRGQRADGCMPDRVTVEGRAVYGPGPENGQLADHAIDNGAFMALLLTAYVRQSGDLAFFREHEAALRKGLDFVTRRDGLVWNDPAKPACPYGFTDTVAKTGHLLFDSLLYWQACRAMASVCEAAECGDPGEYRRRAGLIYRGLGKLWDAEQSLFLAADQDCRQPDIWGSALAVHLGLAMPEQADAVRALLVRRSGELFKRGQIRHLLPGQEWSRLLTPVAAGTYQNGAHWATPLTWVLPVVAGADPELARDLAGQALADFRANGINECVNDGYVNVPGYVVSATSVYGLVKTAN